MIPYILKAGIILAGCLAFYKLLLQKETFFRLNRWVLFICLLISFSLPLIQVPGQWSFRKAAVVYTNVPGPYTNITPVQTSEPATVSAVKQPVEKQGISLQQVMTWIGWFYWFGVSVFGISFLVQVVSLLYRAWTSPTIRDGRLRIVEMSGDKAPCSFGNYIFINPAKYDWETYSQIILHEKVHILQGHSFDIILAEIVLIFQWFNPFAWIYRKELEKNLEFLTDDQVLRYPEVERGSYQLSLVKVSAPHFPLNVTTNYNQSLLKKRVAMMNAKKSNMQTAWKYLFLFPLFVLFISLLNEPKAIAQNVTKNKEEQKDKRKSHGMKAEGYWFATIKGDKVNIQFKNDEDEKSYNSNTWLLSELSDIPRDKSGIFRLKRDAGTMELTGKFDGDQGMGRYKFIPDEGYADAMKKEGLDISEDDDHMVFFMVNVSRNYLQMMRENGYTHLTKNEVIPLAALKVDAAFIKSMKDAGFKDLKAEQLIPLKALDITGDYIREIRNAGFPDISSEQIISFKAQKIDAKYIGDVRNSGVLHKKENKEHDRQGDGEHKKGDASAEDIITFKAMDIDQAYIHSLEEVGYKNLDNGALVPMKAQGINAEYIKSWQSAGFKNLTVQDLIAIKAQDITPAYLKSFEPVGFKSLGVQDAIPLKSLNVTPEYVKSFQSAGFNDLSPDKVISLKAQNITPELIKEYKSLGFDNVSLDDIVAARATGTTPSFINSMREKGHKLRSLDKYIQLRNALEE